MPSSGERVGEYVLDAKVGAGTFGEVWRAKHHVWADRVVAVKVPTDPEYVRALQREGTAVHGLDHPNIVRAINFDPYATPPYLAMEYVPGVSLRGLMASRKLHYREAAQIMGQVLTGLAYAHGQGVVHRDIKPENVLVHERALTEGFAEQGLVKLTDFGLGQRATQYAANSIAYTASIEKGSELAGTIAYMSPEQRSGAELDARSDIYSCGVVLFEMLTGERPAGTELPSELDESLPKALDAVFKRAYSRLAIRYGSAEEFAKELARATAVVPPPLPPLSGGSGRPQTGAAGRVAEAAAGTGGAVGGMGGGGRAAPSCPRCHKAVEAGDQFCMGCGYQLVDRVRRCTSCGAYPHPNDAFCLVCGRDLPGGVGAGEPARSSRR